MPYEEALTLSGHNVPLIYTEPDTSSTSSTSKRKIRRKVMWYNPPYSQSVSTNIGREFLNILTINFPPHHKYHKLFNRNNVKISYPCMPNMRTMIKGHNLGSSTHHKFRTKKLAIAEKKKFAHWMENVSLKVWFMKNHYLHRKRHIEIQIYRTSRRRL